MPSDATFMTFGRTFLQEAVLTVDHERQNFSVSQVKNLNNETPQYVDILSTTSTGSGGSSPSLVANPNNGGSSSSSSSSFPAGAIAGVVVGVVVIIAAILGFFFWRRRKNNRRQAYGQPGTVHPDTPGPVPLPPSAPVNEKAGAAAAELHTPRAGASGDYFGADAYAASMNQHHKAAMSQTSNELDGHGPERGRTRSPAPAYVPTITETPPAGASARGSQFGPAELPAGMAAQELQSRHTSSHMPGYNGHLHSGSASPPVHSPMSETISELAPSPGEDGPIAGAADMGWGSPVDREPSSAERIPISPVRGAQMKDIRSQDRSREANNNSMSATSGPMGSGPLGLGLAGDREPSESLRRNDSTRSRTSRTSDSTLINANGGNGTASRRS